MRFISKDNYYIRYSERVLRVFTNSPDSSWFSEFESDFINCLNNLVVWDEEYISYGIAIRSNENKKPGNLNRSLDDVRSEFNTVLKNIDLYKKSRFSLSAMSFTVETRDNFIDTLIREETKQIDKDRLNCNDRESLSTLDLSSFSNFYTIKVKNNYQSEMDCSFILDKNLIEERLRVLANTPYTKIPFAAMCYSIMGDFVHFVDYECPKCGYISKCQEDNIRALERVRRIVPEFKTVGYDVLMKEPEYCESCLKNEEYKEQCYIFKIRFNPDDEYHIARTNDLYDFVCLQAFLMGGVGYHAKREDEMLHDKIDTINKMTGLGADTVAKWLKTHVKSNIGMFDGW